MGAARAMRPLALGIAAFLMSSAVRAEIPPFYSLGTRPEKDIRAAGVLFFSAPRYAGADARTNVAVPSATVIMANGFFADVINGVGVNLSADPRFEYGLRATVGLGRDEAAGLQGLGRIRDAVNVGGFANYNATERWQVQSSTRYGSGYDRNGLLIDIGTSYDIFQQGPASVSLDLSASYANRSYMQSFYGVSADQAARSGLARYAPRAGQQWTSAGLSVTAPVRRNALAYVSLDYTHLTGYAASSPYARRGDSLTVEASVEFAF